jgi:energy-coupling factor transporter ATP-binding protein EcfA2
MKFKSLKINKWKQFDTVDIEFHDRLTILTGANASGKTTLLNLLARHFGWKFPELSTPTRHELPRKFVKPIDVLSGISLHGEGVKIGEINYTDGSRTDVIIPLDMTDSATYDLSFPAPGAVEGLYISSDRPEFGYRMIEQIPTRGKKKKEAFSALSNYHKNRMLNFSNFQTASYHIKEALIGWGIYGFGSEVIVANQEYKDMYRGFEDVLKKILPEELGFERFSIRESELVLVPRLGIPGEFMIDAVSGGIGALIDLAWQIYTFPENSSTPFIALIDEVETHLHASMQRKLLPSFLEAFPNVQFTVSTHSPLVVSSVRDSSVYVLKFNEERKVESMQLDITNKAKDAIDILRDVLGVSFTMPVWVEEKLNEINEKYSKQEIDESTFASLRKELTEIGLEDLVPYSIDKILSSK